MTSLLWCETFQTLRNYKCYHFDLFIHISHWPCLFSFFAKVKAVSRVLFQCRSNFVNYYIPMDTLRYMSQSAVAIYDVGSWSICDYHVAKIALVMYVSLCSFGDECFFVWGTFICPCMRVVFFVGGGGGCCFFLLLGMGELGEEWFQVVFCFYEVLYKHTHTHTHTDRHTHPHKKEYYIRNCLYCFH